ncbi:MAG: hypothetical protein WDN69_20110 [Aliidongia sp.]
MVAELIAAGGVRNLAGMGDALAETPGAVTSLIELIGAEARKKRPNNDLANAFGFMLSQALDVLRFGIERGYSNSIEVVAEARTRVAALANAGEIDPGTTMLILRIFAGAKLDPGEELQALMGAAMERAPSPVSAGKTDTDRMLAGMVKDCGGDIFAFHALLAEQAAAFPEKGRAGIAAALLEASEPTLRGAALGWLLQPAATTRRDTAALLLQAATAGQLDSVSLRRLIAMRNWLPEDERPAVDSVIRTLRRKGVEPAPVTPPELRSVLISASDGSGAQSVFVMIKDGRKQTMAALLLKRGIGVRDAWVRTGFSKAEADGLRRRMASEAACFDGTMDYAKASLAQALAENRDSGILPPFGLVDVIERIGLGTVNPEHIPVEDLVARLLADLPAECVNAKSVADALAASALWQEAVPFADSWFEDDAGVAALLDGKRLSAKRRAALILEQFLPGRRRRWADMLAWTAFALQQDEAAGDAWIDFALVARELLSDRALAKIPLMSSIAAMTVEAWQYRQS